MARNKEKNLRKGLPEEKRESWLNPETKKSIWAIVFVGIAILLTLAKFRVAGPVGSFIFDFLYRGFGWGYYVIPLILLLLAGVFLTSGKRMPGKFVSFGAVLFILSFLGLVDIVLPNKGGYAGKLVGLLQVPFGYTASIVAIIVIIIASLLIIINLPIRIKWLEKLFSRESKEERTALKVSGVGEPGEGGVEEKEEKKEIEAEEIEETEKEIEKRIVNQSEPPRKTAIMNAPTNLNYVAPPLSLLKSSVEKPTSGDLRANSNIIRRTLESFGIPVEMGEINIGPKFTRYTLKPAEGVKVSRITVLNQDLALALAAHPIRIEAPIPGKSLVGIEVPNKAAAVVRLGSLIAYPEFFNSGPLSFVLGRDVNGEPIFLNIEKMPHLLIAGSTGSGKSIVIHSILTSMLYKNSPQMLRLILIDPKRVELSLYKDLPHLVTPVIVESKKAVGALRWAIKEMERRYELLLKGGCRDVTGYNKKFPDETLPAILIVVDELADLMTTYGREVETCIVRLAQMARATSLHLIVSTQRPSVEVVTGLIKANITSRIALQLPSQIDSRTVLDAAGAEKLLGGGDMLFISSAFSKPKRIQGAFISEEEIEKVTEFIKENNKDFIIPDALRLDENNDSSLSGDYLELDDEDPLYNEAMEAVLEAKKASASLLQRRLRVGYARAARLLDIMESRGIIGPGDGAKPREVYFKEDERTTI